MKKKELKKQLLRALLLNGIYGTKTLNNGNGNVSVANDYNSLDEKSEYFQMVNDYNEADQLEMVQRLFRLEKKVKKLKKRMKRIEYNITARCINLENDMYEQEERLREKQKKMKQQQYEQQKVISRMGGFILGEAYSAKSIHSLNERLDKHKDDEQVVDNYFLTDLSSK